ncbi:ATP-binding cassette domain-containing protein [Cellulosimicrobium sp. PMB13]|uniref:ABC transporter ATP-binding protein n=1 Tax=Cellulosimicrobium sp. PMB13 TaxID=3120158 RepID=UPI003F4C1A85
MAETGRRPAAPGTVAVRTRSLSVGVGHDGVPVLDDVSVDVAEGTGLLVVGPSGCGKSTLLRVLTGVVPHTLPGHVTGDVEVAGHDPREVAVARLAADVGLVQQSPGDQLCLGRVEDELRFALENRAADPATIDERSAHALAAVGATHLRARSTHALSGGEAQRVALAAALVTDPAVLVLDEPTALLDPAGAREVGGVVSRLAHGSLPADGAARRRTVVVVEHRLDELGDLPGATLVLDDAGRVVAHGPTRVVLREHAQRLVELGCWLPLDVVLEAAGAPGPLGSDVTDTWLVDLAAASPTAPSADGPARVALRARSFTVTRSGAPVVHDVDLDLRAGEVLAVVGPNGSGKSTLLRGLAGLEPRSGTLTVAGPTPVAMVFQDPEHQLLARTVRDEVAWSPRLAGVPDLDERVARTLAAYGLGHLADANPFRLSGGEQRRLSLATATVLDPPVLLADEPTFGLDRAQADASGRVLRDLADRGGAVALVTHDLTLVARIADRVAVVVDGEVVADRETSAVLADDALCAGGRLARPPLLEWWARTGRGRGVGLRALVRALDDALASGSRPGRARVPAVHA